MNNESELGKITKFTQLDAWKVGHQLVIQIYQITKKFPKEEAYALVNQMQRCAVSITSNIAEGFSRQSYKEKVQFYSMSLGSVTELQNQLLIAKDVGYIEPNTFAGIAELTVRVHKILNGLIKKSRQNSRYS